MPRRNAAVLALVAMAAVAAVVVASVTDLLGSSAPSAGDGAEGGDVEGTEELEIPARVGPLVSVMDHGAVADGRTDDAAAFRDALDAAAARGRGVSVPAGTYALASAVEIPARVPEVELADGAIVRQTVDAPAFVRRGEIAPGPPVSTGATEGSTTISLADTTAETAPSSGDWLVLASQREVQESKGFRLGSLRKVTSIDGLDLGLDRPLHRDLGDDVDVWTIELAPPVRLAGGTIEHADPEGAFLPLVLLEWVHSPVVTGVEIRECGGSGIKTVGTVAGSIDVDVHDCLDDHDGERYGSGRHYGYGVEVTGPTRDLDVTGTAHGVRHAFTTNGSFPMEDDRLVNVGEPEHIDVSMDVWDTTSSGLDTHEIGYGVRFHDCRVRDAGRYAREGSTDGREGGFGIFIRAPDTVVEGCEVVGSAVTGVVVASPASGIRPWGIERAPRIIDTVISDTRGRTGVELKQNAVVDGVTIEGTHRFGIAFDDDAEASVVRDATIELSGPEKTFAFVEPGDSTLEQNTVRVDEGVLE